MGQTHPNFFGEQLVEGAIHMRTPKSMRAARTSAPPFRTKSSSSVPELPRATVDDAVHLHAHITTSPISYQAKDAKALAIKLSDITDSGLADVLAALIDVQKTLAHHTESLLRLEAASQAPKRLRPGRTSGIENTSFDSKRAVSVDFVADLIGVSRSTVYAWSAAGKFIKQTPMSDGTSRWQLDEVQAWMESRRESRMSNRCRTPSTRGRKNTKQEQK
jgi:predicted DNA-binding transcriptional regulator AlpA